MFRRRFTTDYPAIGCVKKDATGVSARAIAASGVQQEKADNDALAVGVDVVLFWPALLFAKGDGASAAEVSRPEGEMRAIEAASIKNNCGIRLETAPPPKAPKPNP